MGLVKQVVLAIQETIPSETTVQEVMDAMRAGDSWCCQLESLNTSCLSATASLGSTPGNQSNSTATTHSPTEDIQVVPKFQELQKLVNRRIYKTKSPIYS